MPDLTQIAFSLAILLLSLSFHEYAHAATADALGDPLPRAMGRLTINPFAHADLWGTLLFPLICLAMPGGFVFGWAKPVPISNRLDRRRVCVVAAAGPAMNLLIAVLAAGLLHIDALATNRVLLHFVILNVVLAVFNLIPVYPLDGSRVVEGLLPYDAARSFARTARFGFFLLILIIVSPIGQLIIGPPIRALLRILL